MTDQHHPTHEIPGSETVHIPMSHGAFGTPNGEARGWRKWSPLTWVLGLSGAFFMIFLMITGVLMIKGSSMSGKKSAGSALFGGGAVGIVELSGVIMDSKKVLKRLENFEEDPEVKAVVMRINSPGGAVAPSQEIYEAVKKMKKPVVASMASVAASGGYYVACGTQKIFANAGTITGSIGVIMEFVNLAKLYDWAKVHRYALKTGKYKDAGAEYREMQPEEKALLQGMINDVLGQFKAAVSAGRKLTMQQVDAIADGRIFSGQQAKAAKLVDEVGTLDDAVNEAAKLAKIKGKPEVVYPERGRRKLIEMLMDDGRSEDAESETPSRGAGAWIARWLGLPESVNPIRPMLNPGIYWIWTGGM